MGLDFLQNLLGKGQQRQEYQDFVNRYQQGPPHEGYSNQEVANRYNEVAPQLPPDAYQQAAEQAFARLTPEQRAAFAQQLQTQAQQQNVTLPPMGSGSQMSEPGALAQMTTQVHQQQPDILSQLLGGHSGTPLDNPVAKAALAGIAALAAQRFLSGR